MSTPARSPANSAGEKLAQRTSHVLALLHQGKSIDKHQLAQALGVNVCTVERA